VASPNDDKLGSFGGSDDEDDEGAGDRDGSASEAGFSCPGSAAGSRTCRTEGGGIVVRVCVLVSVCGGGGGGGLGWASELDMHLAARSCGWIRVYLSITSYGWGCWWAYRIYAQSHVEYVGSLPLHSPPFTLPPLMTLPTGRCTPMGSSGNLKRGVSRVSMRSRGKGTL
jgi:hypothetical protein